MCSKKVQLNSLAAGRPRQVVCLHRSLNKTSHATTTNSPSTQPNRPTCSQASQPSHQTSKACTYVCVSVCLSFSLFARSLTKREIRGLKYHVRTNGLAWKKGKERSELCTYVEGREKKEKSSSRMQQIETKILCFIFGRTFIFFFSFERLFRGKFEALNHMCEKVDWHLIRTVRVYVDYINSSPPTESQTKKHTAGADARAQKRREERKYSN